MRTPFVRLIGLTAAALLAAGSASLAADPPHGRAAPDIWIKSGARRDINAPIDNMWIPDAPWSIVASRVKVAEFPPGNIEGAKDADLAAAFAEMKRGHIALALGTGLLTQSESCKARNEAMVPPGEFEQMLQKIRKDGGDLRYIVMDEPYYFGHADASGCHQSAEELAANVAQSVAIARRIFPDVEVGDVEVVNASRAWNQQLAAWADAYHKVTGEKLAFMQTDIVWTDLAMRNLKPLSEAMHARRIPFGIIYNADGKANTDASWQASAESHIAEIETALGVHPDIVSFDSWAKNPIHRLPETTPGTLTNIALRYLRPASALSLERHGNTVTGRLTDAEGRPIAGASVAITAVDVGAHMDPTDRILSGTVPAGAASAIFGVRVGVEGACVCDGKARATLGAIRYQEKATGRSAVVTPATRTFELTPGKTFSSNLKQVPVTAGAAYTLDAPMAATASAENAGYATVIFMDGAGRGIARPFLWFGPSRKDLGQAKTDADGRFAFALRDAVTAAQPEIRAAFAGDAKVRPALAIVEP